ncbi:MAG TPA: DinB family protein, partial [Dongiaceae bacterium]|nr:DinB family protein [Dongiaceae bacterium]
MFLNADLNLKIKNISHTSSSSAKQVEELLACYHQIRRQTEALCEPLRPEDFMLQAMPEVSPTKWHLAHTTWFFEALLLKEFQPDYVWVNEAFVTLFNSYYQSVNTPYPRDRRGLLSRPDLGEVFAYRRTIDERMEAFMAALPAHQLAAVVERLTLGLQHEQQHQELILMDIKYNFFC